MTYIWLRQLERLSDFFVQEEYLVDFKKEKKRTREIRHMKIQLDF